MESNESMFRSFLPAPRLIYQEVMSALLPFSAFYKVYGSIEFRGACCKPKNALLPYIFSPIDRNFAKVFFIGTSHMDLNFSTHLSE